MLIVILLDLVVADRDGGIRDESGRNENEVYVCRVVVVGDGPLEHERILIVAGSEEGTVFRIELLGENSVLDIVPVSLQASGVVVLDGVDDVLESGLAEIAVLILESRVLGNYRGYHISGKEFLELIFAHLDSGVGSLLCEQILVHEALPCSIADLLLLLFALGRRAGNHLVHYGEPVDILLEIGVRDSLSVDFTYIIL